MLTVVLGLFRLAASACGTSTGIFPSLYDGLGCSTDAQGGTQVDIKSIADVVVVVGNVARIIIAMSGAIAVIILIVAGIWYITSAGDPGKVKKAKDMIVNTVVGLVVILTAYAVVTTIAKAF